MKFEAQPVHVGGSSLVFGTPVGVIPGMYGMVHVLYLSTTGNVMVHAYALGADVMRPGRVIGSCLVDGTPVLVMGEV